MAMSFPEPVHIDRKATAGRSRTAHQQNPAMQLVDPPLIDTITVPCRSRTQLSRAFSAVLLVGGLCLPAVHAAAQQQELLQLAIASGRMAQLATLQQPEALAELRAQRDLMAKQLEALDTATPPADPSGRYAVQLKRVQSSAQTLAENTNELFKLEQEVVAAGADANQIHASAPVILASMDQLVQQMADAGVDGKMIYVAARQIAVLERLQRRLHEVLQGGFTAITAADGMRRDFRMLSRTQKALSVGEAEIGIAMLEDEELRARSLGIDAMLVELQAPMERLAKAAQALSEAREQSDELRLEVAEFQQRVLELQATQR